jgi:cobalamin-dependent methionine synthase I
MHAGLEIQRRHLIRTGANPAGTFIIGTVQPDHLDFRKNLVAMVLQGKGFGGIGLGVKVPSERFMWALREREANFPGMSRPALHHASLHEGGDRCLEQSEPCPFKSREKKASARFILDKDRKPM